MDYLNKVIVGDCLEQLKLLPESSVDSVVTDPPYHLVSIVKRFGGAKSHNTPAMETKEGGVFARKAKGFMGKEWDGVDEDGNGIAMNKEMWAECLRVLKPGGYLLSFGGTRTYHRMAVAIEDAGFEVRDMIEWVYGSGFPKSLNIGKVTDKFLKTGNASWNGTGDSSNGALGYSKLQHKQDYRPEDYSNRHQNKDEITEDKAKQWEGWGTALKPAHEPICMARKPLGQQELDIAKNICYNITEKGLITNSKIIWRINNVKTAEKKKTKQSSTPTQQQKMVVVSAEFVETKENESVGKKIQKLIESICESGMQETGNKPEKQVQKVISKTKTEYQDTGENINTNEKQKPLKHTEESASVVENQDLSSLPLTTSEVEEDSIEKKSKTETSMSSLKSTDTQKTDIDYSAQTATSQWVCMDIVRTLKVSFEGKEYDFIELSDGSLVWNENLEPYRKQQKLNVAENVLKYGTGGINIDESRVESNEDMSNIKAFGSMPENKTDEKGFSRPWMNDKQSILDKQNTAIEKMKSLGRFPANLILSWMENEYIMKEGITNEQKEKVCTWLQKNL